MASKKKVTGDQLNEKLVQLLQREGELKKSLESNLSELKYIREKQRPSLNKQLIKARQEIEESRNQPPRIKQMAAGDEDRAIEKLEKLNALEQQYRSKIDRIQELLSETQSGISEIRENAVYKSYRKQTGTIGKIDEQAAQMAAEEAKKEGLSPSTNAVKYRTRFQRLKSAFKKKLLSKRTGSNTKNPS